MYFLPLLGVPPLDMEAGNIVGLTTREALCRLRHDIESVLDEYEEFQAKR